MLIRIGIAAQLQGVSASTLRRWEKDGKMLPYGRTRGGHRRYKLSQSVEEEKKGNSFNHQHLVVGGDPPDPLPEIMPMFYYINAEATINSITYSFNLKTYSGIEGFEEFLDEHLDCVIVSFEAKGYLTHYETEYIFGGLVYTQYPVTEHKIIRQTMQVTTGLVYVYDYDEYGNPIGYHCEEHTLVATYGHTVNDEPVSLAQTTDYDLNETEDEHQGDSQLGNLAEILFSYAGVSLSIGVAMLGVTAAASKVAIDAGAINTVMFSLFGLEITYESVLTLLSEVTLIIGLVLVIVGFILLIASLIIRLLAA